MNRTLNVFSLAFSTRSLGIPFSVFVLLASALAGSSEQIIYRFQGGSDGYNPSGALLADSGGNLYGTTVEGGTGGSCGYNLNGCGTVSNSSVPLTPATPGWRLCSIVSQAAATDIIPAQP